MSITVNPLTEILNEIGHELRTQISLEKNPDKKIDEKLYLNSLKC